MFLGPVGMPVDLAQSFLDLVGHIQTEVHVGGLLELATTVERSLTRLGSNNAAVTRSSDPANLVFVVKVTTFLSSLAGDQLHAVVVDEDASRAALHPVCGDGSLDRQHRGTDDIMETFFVNWHLNGKVWQAIVAPPQTSRWGPSGVAFGILLHLANWAKYLTNIANQGLEEEL